MDINIADNNIVLGGINISRVKKDIPGYNIILDNYNITNLAKGAYKELLLKDAIYCKELS